MTKSRERLEKAMETTKLIYDLGYVNRSPKVVYNLTIVCSVPTFTFFNSNLEAKWKEEKKHRMKARDKARREGKTHGHLSAETRNEIRQVYGGLHKDIADFGSSGVSKKRRVTTSVVDKCISVDHGVMYVMAGLHALPRAAQNAFRMKGEEAAQDMDDKKTAGGGASVSRSLPSSSHQSPATADAFDEKPDETKRYNGESDCESGRWFDDGSIQSGRNPSSPRASLDRAGSVESTLGAESPPSRTLGLGARFRGYQRI